MKKVIKKEELRNKAQLTKDKARDILDKTKNKLKEKAKEGRVYAKNNPEKTKAILAGIGAFLVAVVAFFVGRKTRNNNKKNS